MNETQQELNIWKESIRKFNSDWGVLIVDVKLSSKIQKDESRSQSNM